jgi:hypothetical protein
VVPAFDQVIAFLVPDGAGIQIDAQIIEQRS